MTVDEAIERYRQAKCSRDGAYDELQEAKRRDLETCRELDAATEALLDAIGKAPRYGEDFSRPGRDPDEDENGQFRECPTCAAKPGSPTLCPECLARRAAYTERRSSRSVRPEKP